MMKILALILSLVCVSGFAAEVDPPHVKFNFLSTNDVAPPPDDTYVLGVVSGLPAYIQAGTNQTVINSIITNVTFLTAISNYFSTNNMTVQNFNVTGKSTLNYWELTNQLAYHDHVWTTATNTLDMSLSTGSAHYTNLTFTPCAVTGFKFDAGLDEQSVIRLKNASSSNITFTCSAANIHLPTQDLTNPYTVTNGDWVEFWVEIDPDCTNILIKTWH